MAFWKVEGKDMKLKILGILLVAATWFTVGFVIGTNRCPEAQARAAIKEERQARERRDAVRVLIKTMEAMLAEDSERNSPTP